MTRTGQEAGSPIGILCALPQEQELLVEALGDAAPLPGRGLEARRGRLGDHDVVVAAAGVGKVRAASTATLMIERLGCRALVLSGVARGLGTTLGIGDIVVATRVVDIDYGRVTDDGRLNYQPGTLPLPGIGPEPGYQLPADLESRVRSQLALGRGRDVRDPSCAEMRSWLRHVSVTSWRPIGPRLPSRWRVPPSVASRSGSTCPGSSFVP